MKIIKCDRCGKDIPYVPPYMNVYKKDGTLPSGLMVSFWDQLNQQIKEVDLCEDCKQKTQDFIFNYKLVKVNDNKI